MKKRRSREMVEREGDNGDDEEEGASGAYSSIPTGRPLGSSEGYGAEDDDLQLLEEEVREMAERVLSYRRRVPEELKVALRSFLVTSLPDVLRFSGDATDVALGAEPTEPERSTDGASFLKNDQETSKKLNLVKTRISGNVSSVPVILSRMKACIERIDKLEGYNLETHIAFQRRKSN